MPTSLLDALVPKEIALFLFQVVIMRLDALIPNLPLPAAVSGMISPHSAKDGH